MLTQTGQFSAGIYRQKSYIKILILYESGGSILPGQTGKFSEEINIREKWKEIKMTEYDLELLKKMKVLYRWKDDEKGLISKQYAA